MQPAPTCSRPIPPDRGTYAVVLRSCRDDLISAGRLGEIQLMPGYYAYVGSAFGPGGLRARLQHHLRISCKPHWHLDYLRPHMEVVAIWYTLDPGKREHDWAAALSLLRATRCPYPGFGSSDCSCRTHLWYSSSPPAYARFRRLLGERHPDHRQIRVISFDS